MKLLRSCAGFLFYLLEHFQAIVLRERLRYTNYDKELSLFIIQNRNVLPDPLKPLRYLDHKSPFRIQSVSFFSIRPYQMMVIDQKKLKDAKSWGAELLRYQGKGELAAEFEKWIPPRFPVSGNSLKDAGVPGKMPLCLLVDETLAHQTVEQIQLENP